MPIPVLMPALSPTMEEGTLLKWLVSEGDKVEAGDVIAEIETDKATMEVEAVDEGAIGKLLVGEGTEHIAVNKPIALILEEGEDDAAVSSFQADAAPQPAAPELVVTPEAVEEPPSRPEPSIPETPAAAPKANGQGGAPFASPLARRLARENDLNLAAITGSGPHGRIVRRDIEQAVAQGVAPAAVPESIGQVMRAPEQAPAVPGMSDEAILALYEPGTYEVVPIDKMRRIIATRLTQAKLSIPHFRLEVDCEIDALLAARKRLNAMSPVEGPRTSRSASTT